MSLDSKLDDLARMVARVQDVARTTRAALEALHEENARLAHALAISEDTIHELRAMNERAQRTIARLLATQPPPASGVVVADSDDDVCSGVPS